MDEWDIQKECDLLLVLGTSLQVAPVSSIPRMVSADIPAILINREVVGFPNKFDVNLLGNCDDVCCALINKLKWEWMKPIRKNGNGKEDSKEQDTGNDVNVKGGTEIKPIDTESCEALGVEHRYVPPCYYLFPNGTLPDDVDIDTKL